MRTRGFIAAAIGVLVASTPAQSAVIYLDGVTAVGDNFRYDYLVEFALNEGVEDGSTFVIHDFNGYIDGSATSDYPDFITATAEGTSVLPGPPTFADDPLTPNLRFTYNGETRNLSRQTFGMFSALSRFGQVNLDGFSAVSITADGFTAGQEVFTQGPVGVPAVPEPATWAMMIGGFGLIGGAMRRRRSVRTSVRFA